MKTNSKQAVIDCHCHMGRSEDGGAISMDEINIIMKVYPVEFLVLFPIDETVRGKTYEPQNSKMATLASQNSKIIPFGRIDPNDRKAAQQELDRFQAIGIRGIKLHPVSDNFLPQQADFIFKDASKKSLPIYLHTTHKTFREQKDDWCRLFQLTDSPIVIAHAGKDSYKEFIKIANNFPHIYADTTTLSYFRTHTVLNGLKIEKILYGSDLPYSHPAIEQMKYRLLLSENDQHMVFYQNAVKVLQL
jgi:hypothetical protein